MKQIRRLASIFAIDIAADAVMSNHYHLIFHVDSQRSQYWSDDNVIDRWLTIYKSPDMVL